MLPITARYPLMLLAAGWILAALPAAAQVPKPGAGTPVPPVAGTLPGGG